VTRNTAPFARGRHPGSCRKSFRPDPRPGLPRPCQARAGSCKAFAARMPGPKWALIVSMALHESQSGVRSPE
jgi:hypothetical protein